MYSSRDASFLAFRCRCLRLFLIRLLGAGVFLTPSEDGIGISLPFSDLSVSDDPS